MSITELTDESSKQKDGSQKTAGEWFFFCKTKGLFYNFSVQKYQALEKAVKIFR